MAFDDSNIPESWAQPSLEDVCEILDSIRIPVNNSERSKRVEGKSDEELYPYYGATGQVGIIDDFLFDGEHLLLARIIHEDEGVSRFRVGSPGVTGFG